MQYNNESLVARATPDVAGAVYIDRQLTFLADPLQWPSGLAVGDSVQIGVVPAGSVLIPWLCQLQVPQVDSGASGTGAYSIGIAGTPAALVAAQAGAAAKDILPATFVPNVAIGSPTDDVPIYLTLTGALVTQATTGVIKFDVALRAFDSYVDG